MDHINQEDGSHFALPTPTDTSYGSPPRSLSRNSHKRRSSSPNISPPPAPFPPNGDSSPQRGPDAINSATDESISPLDPRRFTPSLHASLVSEILSLRRDVESKTKDIEHLEASLDASRSENESLQETIASTSKEARSMRSQIQLLEGGTVSALSELSKERDEALNDSADLRRRLEQSQKRARSQEESAEKIQMLWDHDRGTWEKEKRALETKVHIVEGRLKVVLSEIANCHMVNGQLQDVNPHESPKKKHLKKGSVASVRSFGSTGRRRDSEVSLGTQEGDFHGYRLSTMTIPNGVSTSLADELAFDEDEEYQMDQNERPEEQGSADELPEERPMSVQSRPFDSKARKVLGLAPEDQLQSLAETEQQRQSIGPNVRESLLKKIQALYEVQYVDAAVQCSPPASPKLIPRADSPQTIANDDKTIYYSDALSHQDPETPLQLTHSEESPFATPKAECPMISTSCQTSIQLPSPPGTPTGQQVPVDRNLPAEMNSTATQTDIFNEVYDTDAMKVAASFVQNLPIPTIAIHPPASRPGTPTGNVVLPPCTKNATCQVNFEEVAGYASSSMQTEEIRVDARATQLPQALVPQRKSHQQTESGLIGRTSALQPANPLPNSSKRRLQPSGSTKQLSRKKGLEHAGERLIQSPTNENEGPAQTSRSENLSRALESRASSRGVEDAIIEDSDEPEWKGFDEDDIFSRPTAKFTLRAGKLVAKDQAETNYQDIFERIDAEADEPEVSSMDGGCMELPRSKTSRRDVQGNGHISRPLERKPRASRSTMSKQADIRKAALISSGTAAHQSAQDDSSGAPIQPPPFPVPTRHSSRKPPVSLSEGAQSPTPGSRSPRKRDGKSRKAGPRKARSANSVDREPIPSRQRSPTPTRISSPYDSTKNPSVDLPPMPFVDPGAPQGLDFAASTSSRGPSRQYSHSRTNSASTVLQSTSVVDAIAQTMVGEWMFKYVRRRKSFGVSEPKATDWDLMRNGELSANITNTGVRHKRWVWLAPYERAVMWSSKQPTSGSALMGKSGRKRELAIFWQSQITEY